MKKWGLILAVILLSGIAYIITGNYLIYNNPNNSKNLLIEDWVPVTLLEELKSKNIIDKADSIYIIGMEFPEKQNLLTQIRNNNPQSIASKKNNNTNFLYKNTCLLYCVNSHQLEEPTTLYINMKGDFAFNYYPHYKIIIDDQIVSSGFVSGKDSLYSFKINHFFKDSLVLIQIQYDNDFWGGKGIDRNLHISTININSTNIDSISLYHQIISDEALRNLPQPFSSNAHNKKHYLEDLGIDPNKIKVIETKYTKNRNITLYLSKAAGLYFQNHPQKDFLIATTMMHSHRTYLNFKNSLSKETNLGCMAIKVEYGKKERINKTDEIFSLIFSYLYWLFN